MRVSRSARSTGRKAHARASSSRSGRGYRGEDLFCELPSKEIETSGRFFTEAFGWQMTPFGPTYACTMTGDVDLGLQSDREEATAGPLVVIQVKDLEASLAAVLAAGGSIMREPFSFPGGRRFHFLDPSGNELAVLEADRAEA